MLECQELERTCGRSERVGTKVKLRRGLYRRRVVSTSNSSYSCSSVSNRSSILTVISPFHPEDTGSTSYILRALKGIKQRTFHL